MRRAGRGLEEMKEKPNEGQNEGGDPPIGGDANLFVGLRCSKFLGDEFVVIKGVVREVDSVGGLVLFP